MCSSVNFFLHFLKTKAALFQQWDKIFYDEMPKNNVVVVEGNLLHNPDELVQVTLLIEFEKGGWRGWALPRPLARVEVKSAKSDYPGISNLYLQLLSWLLRTHRFNNTGAIGVVTPPSDNINFFPSDNDALWRKFTQILQMLPAVFLFVRPRTGMYGESRGKSVRWIR